MRPRPEFSPAPRGVSLLGATGSIGEQALQVVRLHRGQLRVAALSGGRRVERLAEQAREFSPQLVCVAGAAAVPEMRAAVGPRVRVVSGEAGLLECATCDSAEVVLNGLVGARGLAPSLAALEAGKTLALANKETLVAGGPLAEGAARRGGGQILAVDSEHWALGELLEGRDIAEVRQVWITASGGPLRGVDPARFEALTPEEVLAHPVWAMGRRITVDSATLLNKGFEVLEARWLFGLPLERVGAVVHPEALAHALVEWGDGSWTAQLSTPSMALPIQRALLGRRAHPTPAPPLGLLEAGALRFEPIDTRAFPCYELARAAGEAGGTLPAALNAADEVVVEAFLEGRIPFPGIAARLRRVLERHHRRELECADDVWEADREARELARGLL
ncbi:MAG TPA: 1-deoxy-D-xylulose-5-phosphate reductoisomerase [Candidatus Saccharimonadales bacterium]|nr:1-deoxy-D-xylulose-5-phosphate reductoisomerase [Candidatus Saccharimonadales bacterium]